MNECSCPRCVKLCRISPGWGTPAEIRRLIELGHGDKLMLDWWYSERDLSAEDGADEIQILSPATRGCEGRRARDLRIWEMLSGDGGKGECTFLRAGKCTIHAVKPLECREVFGCAPVEFEQAQQGHLEVAATWNNAEARALVAAWKKGRDL